MLGLDLHTIDVSDVFGFQIGNDIASFVIGHHFTVLAADGFGYAVGVPQNGLGCLC